MEPVRVSDDERRWVADRLARAQAEGRLGLAEFDERVRAAYGAVVLADLEPLTADLPVEGERRRGAAPRERAGRAAGSVDPGLRAAVAAWVTVSALNLAIWAVVALAVAGPVYPWWIWVAGPWGVMVAMRALAGRAGPVAPLTPCGPRQGR